MGSTEGNQSRREQLEEEINGLQRELDELVRSLPQHSVKPSQMMRIEELEDEIAEREAERKQLGD